MQDLLQDQAHHCHASERSLNPDHICHSTPPGRSQKVGRFAVNRNAIVGTRSTIHIGNHEHASYSFANQHNPTCCSFAGRHWSQCNHVIAFIGPIHRQSDRREETHLQIRIPLQHRQNEVRKTPISRFPLGRRPTRALAPKFWCLIQPERRILAR